jgi:hypothetical protein
MSMQKLKVNVSIADESIPDFEKVAQRLKEAGLNVEQELESIGVVTGSIESNLLLNLEQVEGVAAVEQQQEIHLPPSGSDVQ